MRNLVLAIIDDEQGKQFKSHLDLVSLLKFDYLDSDESKQSRTDRIGELIAHAEHASHVKLLEFDLLSIDINFQDDSTDPMTPEGEARKTEVGKMSASGLYHGLALLARRSDIDRAGNRLPLAWEIRSITPSYFEHREDLSKDALRGYALLRSLLASRGDSESFVECIRREHKYRTGNTIPKEVGTVRKVLLADLVGQNPSSGDVDDILVKLLPVWRRQFRKGVEAGGIVLSLDEMDGLCSSLSKFSEQHDSTQGVDVDDLKNVGIPIAGRVSKVESQLRLSSVFADLCYSTGKLQLNRKYSALKGDLGIPMSVLEWIDVLIEAASPKEERLFESVQQEFEKGIASCEKGAIGKLWWDKRRRNMDRRFLLYILMRVRLALLRTSGNDQFPTLERTAYLYGIDTESDEEAYNPRMFIRPLAENRMLQVLPSDLNRDIKGALLGSSKPDGNTLVRSPMWERWLKRCLLSYATKSSVDYGLGLSEEKLKKVAPGLVG